jgi:squalene-associated FAD-dependent desaturase
MSTPGERPRVVVIGGGLSGLSAAVSCADAGARVTVLEGRPRLGGATWSFERNGRSFDNGQHVHLRCCEAYRGFLDRLGTGHLAPFAGPLSIPVLRPGRGDGSPSTAWIKRDNLPAPFHLARSLLSYGHLSVLDRLRLGPAALGLRLARLGDPRLDSETFSSFLQKKGQSQAAIERLWDLIVLPTTNLRASEVSLTLAAKVFKTGLLTVADAADIAWSNVPLSELHVEPARRLLESLGADVRKKARVSELLVDSSPSGDVVSGVRVEDTVLDCDAAVLAVGHEEAAGLLPDKAAIPADELAGLGTVPIVNVHFVFGKKVMDHRLAAAVDSPAQFIFDRTAAAHLAPEEEQSHQVIAISLSGAEQEIGKKPQELIESQLAALRQLFPAAREVEPIDAVVTREHDATFRGRPGTARLRPGARTGLSNLALAGAWTDTGWPATMEGAVRSGLSAAELVISRLERRQPRQPRQEVSA